MKSSHMTSVLIRAAMILIFEVVSAARARHLAVTTYTGIHTAATAWEDVVDAALPRPAG